MSARRLEAGKLVIASHNQGKVREIGVLLAPFGMDVVSAGTLGLPEPEETEQTFVGNAKLKALAAARATGLPALSDDSGLEVIALGGAPGVVSARWAGPDKDFAAAMARVWSELAGKSHHRARFVCVLAIGWPDGHTETFEGEVKGEVTWPPRGHLGFGYDPIFQAEGQTLSFGEMRPEAKEQISHRADAFRKLVAACLAG